MASSTKRRRQRSRRQSFKDLVALWVDLFKQHNLLTYASAIAFQALVALVALVLLLVAILGEIGRADVWTKEIGPQIEPKVLPAVYSGIDATFQKVFSASSVWLIAFAAAVALWEISGAVRAAMGALSVVYGTDDDRPWWRRFPISVGIGTAITGRSSARSSWRPPGGRSCTGRGASRSPSYAGCSRSPHDGRLRAPRPVRARAARTKRWASAGAAVLVVAWTVQSVIFWAYLRYVADYRSAAGSLLGVYFLTTYLYVAAIVLLVAIELDEQLRKDLKDEDQERGILGIVRDVF